MKPIIELIFQKFGHYLSYIDGYKSYILGTCVFIIGVVQQNPDYIILGVGIMTGKSALRKIESK